MYSVSNKEVLLTNYSDLDSHSDSNSCPITDQHTLMLDYITQWL